MKKVKYLFHVEQRNILDLKPFEKNPRRITEKGLRDLQQSTDKFRYAEIITINLDNMICGGHARYFLLKSEYDEELKANKKHKLKIDVTVPDKKMTKPHFKELNIRLNKNIAGEFDFDILANENDAEDLLKMGFETWELGQAGAVDYSVLDDENLGGDLSSMELGVKRAIQIEFSPKNFPKAKELVKFHRLQGNNVGEMLIEILEERKNGTEKA